MSQQIVNFICFIQRLSVSCISFLSLLFLIVIASYADDGDYSASPHGSTTHGVLRLTELPQGSCGQCHISHDVSSGFPFSLFTQNSNQLCFSASTGGCHADLPAGATAGYPAQESDRMPIGSSDPGYFEFNSGGVRVPGVENLVRWPGRIVWEDPLFSPHYADQDMPFKDFFGYGSCDNCHNVHGSGSPHDMLDTTYAGIVGSDGSMLPENYTLCLNCHNVNGSVSMDDTSRSIAYFYDRSINPGSSSGHGISSGGGYVSPGSRLPCYDCHNPHGSMGRGGQGANGYLLSDQRSGWYSLTDIRNNNDQARRFCFGCHPSSDNATTTEPVEGISLQPLPSAVAAHTATSAEHCYDCHGRDYSTPTSNNVHNPGAGGDCLTCHNSIQGSRREIVSEFGLNAHHVLAIGQNGTITNNDCGVCHMEGNAASGAIDGSYHRNGLVELRDPDNGLSLIGFDSFTRDLLSPLLESWVVDVQNNFCLRCHDANGALSQLAQVPGASAMAPFSDPVAAVIDVNTSFDPANAVYHPVLAPGSNPFTIPSQENNFTITMEPPFNQSSNHDMISCIDCHEASGHGSSNTGMLLEETYFRDAIPNPSFATAQRAFCTRCHSDTYYIFNSENASRFDKHDKDNHVQPGSGDNNNHSCRGCHAGVYDVDQDAGCDNGSGIGRIHGSNFTYLNCSPTSGVTPISFLFGGYLKGWQPVDLQTSTCYANCHHPNGEDY